MKHPSQSRVNLGDYGSRGVCATYFQAKCPWKQGPKFLRKPEYKWPAKKVRRHSGLVPTRLVINLLLQRYSYWSFLLRIVSWVLRFVKHVRKEKPPSLLSRTLSFQELEQARNEVVQLVRRQYFYEDYLALNRVWQVKCHKKLANLRFRPTVLYAWEEGFTAH